MFHQLIGGIHEDYDWSKQFEMDNEVVCKDYGSLFQFAQADNWACGCMNFILKT